MKDIKISQAWKDAAAPLPEVLRSLPMTLRAKLLTEGYKFGVDLTHKMGPEGKLSAVIEPPKSYVEKGGKRIEPGSKDEKAFRKSIKKAAKGLKL